MADDTLVEEIHAPNGGLVDTVQLDLLRGSDAQVMINFHHDRLALERRAGYVQTGLATPDQLCYGGFHYRQNNGNQIQLRVQGGNLTVTPPTGLPLPTKLYKGSGWDWIGAQSNLPGASVVDIIGNGQANGNGSFIQYADRVYWFDAGTYHKVFNGAVISDWGVFAGATLPAGTLSQTPATSAGNPFCFSLDGTNYLSLGVTGINGATDFTFSCWVQTSSTAVSGLMGTWKDATHFSFLFVNSLAGAAYRGEFEFKQGASYSHAQSFLVNDGVWHLLTGVRSGSQLTLYRDGAPGTTVGAAGGALQATALYVGVTRYGGAVTNFLTGLVDDPRFYSRALSAAEVAGLYLGTEPDTTGLQGWWRLNEGSGGTIADSSPGAANSGTVVGTPVWSTDAPQQIQGGSGTGQLQAGTYKFVYTYYNPTTAEESPPSEPSNAITLGTAGQSLTATAPANAAWSASVGFTVIRWYRTTVDGAAFLFDHETSISALPASTVLSQSDETLGAEVEYTRGAVPRIRYCILFNEMVVGAGNPDEPSKLYWSAVGDPTHWPPEHAQDIDRDNGDPITGIFRLLGRLYVLKQTSGVYMLTPQTDSTGAVSFTVEAITSDWGCLSHHSIQVIDTYVYWADAKGIVRFNGQQCENISDPKIRYRWKALAESIGFYAFQQLVVVSALAQGLKPPAQESYAIHDRKAGKDYYRLTIGDFSLEGSATVGAVDLIYDISIGCWFEDRRPARVNGRGCRVSWLIKDVAGQYHVMQADDTGRAYRRGTNSAGTVVWTDTDNVPTTSQWKSKWFGGMYGVVPKWLEIEYERGDIGYVRGPVTVNLYQDGKTTPITVDSVALVPYATNSTPPPLDSTLPDPTRLTHCIRIDWDAEWCRRFAFEFVCSALDTQLRILQFKVSYYACGEAQKAR